jgi:hypothetical protein
MGRRKSPPLVSTLVGWIQHSASSAQTWLLLRCSLLPPRLVRALRLYTDHSTAAETCQSFPALHRYSTTVLATAHYTRAAPGHRPMLTGVRYRPQIICTGYWPMLIGVEYVRDVTTLLPRASRVRLDGITVARRRLLRTHKHGRCAVFIRRYIAFGYNTVPTCIYVK